jgi:hypothetical protein
MGWSARWLDADWYRYLSGRYPDRVAVVAVIGLAALAVGGYLSVQTVAGSGTALARATYAELVTTVTRKVEVHEPGRVVVERIPVVKRVYARPVTVMMTHTVHTHAGVRIVTRPVVRYRRVYRTHVVRIHGEPVTVRDVVTKTNLLTATQLATITNEHTSTIVQDQSRTVTQTATVTRTETAPPQTVTVTGPASTVTTTTEVVTTETVTVAKPPPGTQTGG